MNGAVINDNYWSNEGICEGTGNKITMDGNTIVNGQINDYPSPILSSFASEVAGNTLSIDNTGLFAGTQAEIIQVSGFETQTKTVSQVIAQTAESFNIASGAVAFTPQTVAGVPPSVTVTSSAITGGSGNAYQNWAFTLSGASNSKNNGTYIITASTSNSVTFVNPKGVSETLPSGATLVSSATTADYLGSFNAASPWVGGFNNLAGQDKIVITGFTGATNNTGATSTGTSYSWSASVGTVQSTNSWGAGQVLAVSAPSVEDIMYPFNGQTITVISTGLSSSQFEFTSGVGGSGSTAATFTAVPLNAIANSLTVIATTNPSAVNETHAGTVAFAPAIHNANIGPNSVNMGVANNGSDICTGVAVGTGADGPGPVYESKIHDNTIFSAPAFNSSCTGIFVAGTSAYPISGVEFTNNDVSNMAAGYWLYGSLGTITDITINGGKFTNVPGPIGNSNNIPLRKYNTVESASQTSQNLQGGATVDATGGFHDGSASSQSTMLGNLSMNGGAEVYAPNSTSNALYVFAGARSSTLDAQQWAAPFATPIAAPTSTGATSGGSIGVNANDYAYVTCQFPVAQATAGQNISASVATTSGNQTIPWAWPADSACTQFRIWPTTSLLVAPTSYFISTTNSYTQTTASGTSGGMDVGTEGDVAVESGDGQFSGTGFGFNAYGQFNAAYNPIPACGGDGPEIRWVTDAVSEYGPYTSGGSDSIPVACIFPGATWTSMLGSSGGRRWHHFRP